MSASGNLTKASSGQLPAASFCVSLRSLSHKSNQRLPAADADVMLREHRMKSNIYIINSPSFPKKQDFEHFGAWCEWHDPEEVPYIKFLCSSSNEFEELIIKPYEEGKETYYPVVGSNKLPDHTFMYVRVVVPIGSDIELVGYVSISENEIVALTILPDENPENEIHFYRSDRLVAEDENPASVLRITEMYNNEPFSELNIFSNYRLSDGSTISGNFEIGQT